MDIMDVIHAFPSIEHNGLEICYTKIVPHPYNIIIMSPFRHNTTRLGSARAQRRALKHIDSTVPRVSYFDRQQHGRYNPVFIH